MIKSLKVLAPLFAIATLSGCAFSIHETPVNYEFDGVVEPDERNTSRGIVVNVVTDDRAVDRPDIISHLVNGYGQTTSGGFVAEAPLSDIVKSGIQEALVRAGYKSHSDDLTLDAVLENYEYDAVSGFWSVKNITAQLTLSIKLSQGDTIVARNTVLGDVKLNTEELKGKPDKELVVLLFKRSLDDALEQVVEIVEIETNR
jgi:hypothetical protein